MKEVIKTVKAEIKRLRPIVEEFNRLENLLAFLEGPNKDITNIDDGTIKKRVYYHNTPVKITDKMNLKLQKKYDITPGDSWHSVDDMKYKLGISQPAVSYWCKRKYIEFFER